MLKCVVLLTVFCSYVAADVLPKNIPNYFRTSNLRAGANPDSFVAFSAGLTNSSHLAPPYNVTYDRVWTNYGNGYDASTGIFTCPHAGTYVFFYYAMAQSNTEIQLDLYQNQQYIATGYAHTAKEYGNAGNVAVLTLSQGDKVYVHVRADSQLYGQPDEVYCTFSGFILYPEHQSSQGGIIGK